MLAAILSHWKLMSLHSMLNVCAQPELKSEVIYLDDNRLDTLAYISIYKTGTHCIHRQLKTEKGY